MLGKTKKQKIDEILDELLMIDKKTKQELEIVKKELHEEIKNICEENKYKVHKLNVVVIETIDEFLNKLSFDKLILLIKQS